MRGRLSICGHHGNKLRYIVYFFYYHLYMFMPIGQSNFPESWLLPWKQRLKNQVFKKYMIFFADLLALKDFII